MRKLMLLLGAGLLALAGFVPAASAAGGGSATTTADRTAGQPYCGITWGSLPKQAGTYTSALITDVRSGRHECFDRLVVDLGPGPVAGYHVEYVPEVVQPGSGEPVPLAGGAFLSVNVQAWDYDFETGEPSYDPPDRSHLVDVTGYQTFRQVAHAGTFEGQATFGLGVRARLPFRVFTLTGPGEGSRLVIDVAHRW